MKKKMLIFIVVLIVLFAALYFVVDYKNKQAVDENDNPYGKSDLHQATIDQLDDPNYQNQILPDELDKKLENGKSLTVYFYDPTCPHCQRTTPILVPLTEELGVDVKKLNVLEFEDAWNKYSIEGTPTLIHFENGKEATRISGGQTEEQLRAFFKENNITE
ncbi:thiol reductase thioredoxin [Virgibacillus phasianinus]|uniref:Thiol reductase thioredoxin n=1 Tax=Virgibacillus phasianinus TaxID=2017483 RepID=A0A220TYW1_9BACI|nr:thioredoxin family protein [Virgibacillus phasianinus]ASK60853.1 thiol reductase thioredoxin [Virgibacillus phasianinus]